MLYGHLCYKKHMLYMELSVIMILSILGFAELVSQHGASLQ
jgi:hypothetical protein